MVEWLRHELETMGGTMMISVRKWSFITAAILLLVCVFSVSALADTDLTSGNASEASSFYVESYGNATLVLSQVEGSCNYLNYAQSATGTMGVADAWGMYHIVVTAPGGSQYTQNWESMNNGGSFSLQLYNAGTYQIQLVPYSGSEITTAWGVNRFVRWNTYPVWWVDNTINCTVRENTSTVITVQQVDANTGTVLASRSESVYYGNNTVDAPATPNGYRLASSGSVSVYVDNYGNPSTYTVTFYYAKEAQIQAPGSVSVNCYDESGKLLKSYSEYVVSSRPVIPRYIEGYYTTSNSVFVTYSNGSCSPYSLNFFYKAYPNGGNPNPNPTAVPAPTQNPNPTAAPAPTQNPNPNPNPNPSDDSAYRFTNNRASTGSIAEPTQWGTQFNPVTSSSSKYNDKRYQKLGNLCDDNYQTSFNWLIWSSESADTTPELTAYFNNETIRSIGIRNGFLRNSSEYDQYARARAMTLDIYDASGARYTVEISLSEGYSTDYQFISLGATYQNVVRIDFWINKFKVNGSADSDHKNVVHIADIQFYK